ncbi:MAG: phage major capsid protein [Pseudomonadota bacterium]
MPPELTEILARFDAHHASVVAMAKDVTDTKKSVSAFEKDIDAMSKKIAALQHGGGSESSEVDPTGASINHAALKAEREAIVSFYRNGSQEKLLSIRADMSVGSEPDGGLWVAPTMSSAITRKLFDASPITRLARTVTMTSGSEFQEPIDAGDVGAVWAAEQEPRPQTSSPKLGLLTVPLHEIYSNVPVTQKLLDVADWDVGAWLQGKISDRFVRSISTALVSGDGAGKPRGILSYTNVAAADAARPWGQIQYVPTGGAAGFADTNPADALKALMWSLRAPYRTGANWLMNSTTLSVVDKMKDGQGNYLLRPGLTAGMPNMLLGYPVEVDENMPDIGANALPIAFGNFRLAYLYLNMPGLRLMRDPFTAKPNVLFYAYQRVGGAVANSEAIKLLKCAAN